MEKREEKIDLLKGLATVLVVIGHNIAYGSGITYLNNENFYDNFLFKVIYSFHMPLFMLLSGYVFLFSINRYDPIKIIFRKVRQLLLPVFSWQTIWYIAFMVCKGGTFSVKGWFVSCLNSIWFLWAAFFCAMIVILGHILFDDHEIYYIILWILMFFMPDVGSTALYKFVYPYFVIGYLYHKRKASFESKNIKTSAAVSACVWLQLLQFYDYNSYIYNSGYFMQPKVDVYRFAIGLAGSIFVIAMVEMIHTNSAETNALGG